MKTYLNRMALQVVVLAILGSAAPLFAHAAPPPEWDRSSIALTCKCLPDGRAEFIVTNTGEDMAGPSTWRAYANDVFSQSGTFQLAAGAVQIWTFTSDGVPVRFEADQRPGHPGNSAPKLTLTCSKPTAVTLSTFSATGNAQSAILGSLVLFLLAAVIWRKRFLW